MKTPKDAQEFLDGNFAPWVLAMSPKVTQYGPEGATLEVPITPDIMRVGGIVCGQAMGALADTTMVFACIGTMPSPNPIATTNLETRFLSAAKGDTLICRARVIKQGRALFFAEAELITTPNNRTVAAASATFYQP